MFNLLMFNVDWDLGRVTVPLARVFEYTEPEVVRKFRNSNTIDMGHLTALPCLFCVEGTTNEIARVGQINRVNHINKSRLDGGELVLEISFDSDAPPLENRMLYANRIELNMPRDFEFSRNHWAVKDVDLYRFLLRNVRPRRQRPTVFQIPEHENIEPTLASAMMPFDRSFSDVYDSIREACENVDLRCRRADDIWENAAIIQDVVSLIDRSRVVICDCSGRNPNVFYEAGMAHMLGREVILITQSEHDIPFDLRHLRYIRYLNNAEGRVTLVSALESRMQTILGH